MENEAWKQWVGQVVVVDTDSSFVYLGMLAEVNEHFVVLRNVDAHDRGDSTATKERYVMDVRQFGIRANRKEVAVRRELIVSLSRLDDVIAY